MNAHLILAVLALIALRVGFLYLAPFGRCPKVQRPREHPARPPPLAWRGLPAFRARRRLEDAARAVSPNLGAVSPLHRTARAAQPLPEPRQAIEAPRQVHLHFHGVDPADVAELIRRHNGQE